MNIRSIYNGLIAAREKEARRRVHEVLMSMDDETLRRVGYSRNELSANIRRTGSFL
ncbi:MAG: hypothetical protein AAF468_03655 [Pseudomonadota bacterium]